MTMTLKRSDVDRGRVRGTYRRGWWSLGEWWNQ